MRATCVREQAGEHLLRLLSMVRQRRLDEGDRPAERRSVGGEHPVDVGAEVRHLQPAPRSISTAILGQKWPKIAVESRMGAVWALTATAGRAGMPLPRRSPCRAGR